MTNVVLDTSAVVAILQGEEEADALIAALEKSAIRRMSAASVLEAAIVLHARFGDHGERELDLFLQRVEVEVVPVTAHHAELARQAYRRFGRSGNEAGLDFGDCFAYALAVALDDPLLVGSGFGHTDLVAAGALEPA